MYVAVKGGERAILNSHRLLDEARRGDTAQPELTLAQIRGQLGLAVDRVMAEGSLYDPHLAALALPQACGDTIEAAFLLRAYRTPLPRFALSPPVAPGRRRMRRRQHGRGVGRERGCLFVYIRGVEVSLKKQINKN